MHAILRIGPYVGDGYDLGGLPPWLVPAVDRQVRGANPQFLQACSKFIAQLASKIADLQVTRRPRKGSDGPIVMINLLKFKDRAEYAESDPEQGDDISGFEAYQRYGAGVAKLTSDPEIVFTPISGPFFHFRP